MMHSPACPMKKAKLYFGFSKSSLEVLVRIEFQRHKTVIYRLFIFLLRNFRSIPKVVHSSLPVQVYCYIRLLGVLEELLCGYS